MEDVEVELLVLLVEVVEVVVVDAKRDFYNGEKKQQRNQTCCARARCACRRCHGCR